jgi:uncharacterized coiled-coil protein SlyX
MSHDEPTPVYHHPAANATLAHTMHELSCELVALRQEMRNLRDTVRELRDQVGDLRTSQREKRTSRNSPHPIQSIMGSSWRGWRIRSWRARS